LRREFTVEPPFELAEFELAEKGTCGAHVRGSKEGCQGVYLRFAVRPVDQWYQSQVFPVFVRRGPKVAQTFFGRENPTTQASRSCRGGPRVVLITPIIQRSRAGSKRKGLPAHLPWRYKTAVRYSDGYPAAMLRTGLAFRANAEFAQLPRLSRVRRRIGTLGLPALSPPYAIEKKL